MISDGTFTLDPVKADEIDGAQIAPWSGRKSAPIAKSGPKSGSVGDLSTIYREKLPINYRDHAHFGRGVDKHGWSGRPETLKRDSGLLRAAYFTVFADPTAILQQAVPVLAMAN